MIGSMQAAFVMSIVGFVQPLGSAIVFIVVGLAFDKAKIKTKYHLSAA